jgi:hypothetical protein
MHCHARNFDALNNNDARTHPTDLNIFFVFRKCVRLRGLDGFNKIDASTILHNFNILYVFERKLGFVFKINKDHRVFVHFT